MSEFSSSASTTDSAQLSTSASSVKNSDESDATKSSHMCETLNCGKSATMACPTCIKLGIIGQQTNKGRFCSQDCFKLFWEEHKSVHKDAKKGQMPPEFKNFQFTGNLRPFQRSPRRIVPPGIMRPDYADDPIGASLSEQVDKRTNTSIKSYSPSELSGIREACRIGREVLDLAGRAVRVGITCDELDRIVHEATVERGAYPSPLNYYKFPKSVCTSVNEVICHGIPDYRELQDGDIVNIDVS
eukprot:gene33327-44609_t